MIITLFIVGLAAYFIYGIARYAITGKNIFPQRKKTSEQEYYDKQMEMLRAGTQTIVTTTFDRDHEERKRLREQRRYELAKAAMQAIITHSINKYSSYRIASDSLMMADAMLAELEKGDANTNG